MPSKLEINGKSLISELAAEVQINGVWMNEQQAAENGFTLQETASDCRRIRVKNQSKKTVRLGGIRWHHSGHHDDFLHAPGRDFRICAEGWMMASPCGVKKFGDHDFNCHPGYRPFAICRPEDYSENTIDAAHPTDLGFARMTEKLRPVLLKLLKKYELKDK